MNSSELESLCAKLRTKLHGIEVAAPLIEQLDALDSDSAVADIVLQLESSFVRYRDLLATRPQPITAIRFYWAGAEIEPWVPSQAMGNVYAGATLLLDSSGGFDPTPLPILCDAIADSAPLGDHAAFADLKALFVAESLELARRAIELAAAGEPFAALATARPFEFFATPGHGEAKLLVLRLA